MLGKIRLLLGRLAPGNVTCVHIQSRAYYRTVMNPGVWSGSPHIGGSDGGDGGDDGGAAYLRRRSSIHTSNLQVSGGQMSLEEGFKISLKLKRIVKVMRTILYLRKVVE